MKSLTIKYFGKDEIVEIDDDISLGKLEKIVTECIPPDSLVISIKDGRPNIDFDLSKMNITKYRKDLTVACLIKYPWEPGKFDELPNSIASKVIREVMAEYPAVDLLQDFLQSLGMAPKIKKG